MIDCGACDGKGGYATDHEGDEVETCNSCHGSGLQRCGYCDNSAIGYVRETLGGKLQRVPACESCYKDFPADDRCAT